MELDLIRAQSVTGSVLEDALVVARLVQLLEVALDVFKVRFGQVADVAEGLLHEGVTVVLGFYVSLVEGQWRCLQRNARYLFLKRVTLFKALQLSLHVIYERLYVLLSDLWHKWPLIAQGWVVVVVLLSVNNVFLDEGQVHGLGVYFN